MSADSTLIHFQNGTIINANNSIERPLNIAKQGKDLTAQLAEDIAEEMADDPSLKELLEETHQQMLTWAQFELTCGNLKSVISDVNDMGAKDEISHLTNLDSIMNPKFDAVAAADMDEKELKKTTSWLEYMAKVNEILDPEGLDKEDDREKGENDGDSDDDMLVTQAEVNLNCPITRKQFVKPMKNKKCNHIYDQEGIDMLLAQRESFKCPVPSCSNKSAVFKADLEPDRRILRILKTKQK